MIHHVTRHIPPASLQECVRFYEILGFGPVPTPPGISGDPVWLGNGDTQIHLMPVAAAHPEHGHVGIVVEDYAATLEALRSAGHIVEPRREHWGSPRGFVRDPAGNLVELMAWRPGNG